MKVPIQTESGEAVSLEVVERNSKKTGKPYRALEVIVGKYRTLIFPTPFELDYLEQELVD